MIASMRERKLPVTITKTNTSQGSQQLLPGLQTIKHHNQPKAKVGLLELDYFRALKSQVMQVMLIKVTLHT